MPVVHIMGVGRSPGATTTALYYMAHNRKLFAYSGSDKAEKIVFFTTEEVFLRRCPNKRPILFADNEAGKYKQPIQDSQRSCWQIIKDFIRREQQVAGMLRNCQFLLLEADLKNVNENVRRLVYFLAHTSVGSFGGRGKEIWVNLTGGTNVINISLLIFASLGHAVSTAYYTFVENHETALLRPGGTFEWMFVPLLRFEWHQVFETALDSAFERTHKNVLAEAIKGNVEPILVKLGRLVSMDEHGFLRLTDVGKQVRELMQDPIARALLKSETLNDDQIVRACEQVKKYLRELS